MTKATSGFFALGNAFGLAHSAITVNAAIELQCALEASELTIAAYTLARAEWVKGYAAGFECTDKRAENAWAELFALTGLKKPQTAEAARKAAVRKAAKSADGVNPNGKASAAPVAPVTGDAKATDAKEARTWALNATEENLIKWFREGKFAMIEALISAQAPM